MNVRRAAPGDEAVLRALRLEALSEAPEAFGSTSDRELARPAMAFAPPAAKSRGSGTGQSNFRWSGPFPPSDRTER